jgi:hypothetical protein
MMKTLELTMFQRLAIYEQITGKPLRQSHKNFYKKITSENQWFKHITRYKLNLFTFLN